MLPVFIKHYNSAWCLVMILREDFYKLSYTYKSLLSKELNMRKQAGLEKKKTQQVGVM